MTAGKKKMDEKNADTPDVGSSLRDYAEEQLARSPKSPPLLKRQTAEELIHELEVHQIELETQAEELRKAHLALEQSRDKYLDLFEFAPLGFLTLTDKALVTEANLTCATLLGIERNKLIRARFSKFVAEADSYEWNRYFANVLNQGGKTTCTLRFIRGDGSMFPARLESILVTDGSEGARTVWVTISDVRDVKQLEDALRVSNTKLNILSSITRHDINNQLSVLMGRLDLLDRTQFDHQSDKFLQGAEAAAERISALIQFTEAYEDVGVHAPTWQDVRALVSAASGDLPLENVRIVNDVPAGTEVLADLLIAKVFYNLISNAVRHGGKITTIHFSVKEVEGARTITCEDDGAGVSADMKDKLFTRGSGKDHGFGLFLSREILAITGITIAEEGLPGCGARFVMTIPAGELRELKTDGS